MDGALDMMLPETISPEDLAKHMGWSTRRVKSLARELGTCRIVGGRMVLTESDVAILMLATKPDMTVDDVRHWLGEDAAELHIEAEAQGFREPTGVVYFVQRGSEIKIGYTNDMAKRLTNFRTATTEPFKVLLTIPATTVLEGYFHDKFAEDRIEREWFKASPELLAFIARRTFGR
jgi:hypothetical protein